MLVLGCREPVRARNEVPRDTSLLLPPPCRNTFPSTKPWPSPTLGRTPGLSQPGTKPQRQLLSLLLASPCKPSRCSPRHASSHPCHPGTRFWQLSRCPQPRASRCPSPPGDPAPPGTPRGVGASRGRQRGAQRGALRAPMLRSQGYHVMLGVAMETVVSHKKMHK